MKTILLTLPTTPILWIVIVIALGLIWCILIKTPDKEEKIVDNTINSNIQKINKMGYHPEEDDELTGYEHAEKPHIEKSGGYINEHLKSVVDEN